MESQETPGNDILSSNHTGVGRGAARVVQLPARLHAVNAGHCTHAAGLTGRPGKRNVDLLNSKIYRVGEILVNLILLNLLWLVACLPVVTAFPATAAMFGVVRDWLRDTDSGITMPFVRHFRANFAQSLWIGFLWVVVAGVLVVDFIVVGGLESWLQVPAFSLLALVTLCVVLTSLYIFPVMVNYESQWLSVIKNSFLIAISQLGTTLLCLLVVGSAGFVLLYVPVAGLMAGSGVAYVIYFLCGHAFRRIEAAKGIES
jgi:uncharacterized membrane protein YesL